MGKKNKKTYFLLAPALGLVKIGCSDDPLARVEALRTMNAADVELLAVVDTPELELHQRFREYRKHGEWFTCDNAIAVWLQGQNETYAYTRLIKIGQELNV
jgi:hypothetical protein